MQQAENNRDDHEARADAPPGDGEESAPEQPLSSDKTIPADADDPDAEQFDGSSVLPKRSEHDSDEEESDTDELPGPVPELESSSEDSEPAAGDETEPATDEEELEPEAEEPGEGEKEADEEAEEGEEEESGERQELAPEALALCRAAIEAMLFSSSAPLSTRKMADALSDLDVDGRVVRRILLDLAREYTESRRGFAIEEVAGGFKMQTRPEFADYVSRVGGGSSVARLSQAALETLAVVAYKQPVTRADIESIRGVQAGPLLRTLLHRGLVKISGRAEVLGRPLLYVTTRKFLERFGLKSLSELPRVEELPRPE